MSDKSPTKRNRTNPAIVDDTVLNDFVSGRLDSVAELRVAAMIECNPELQSRVAALSGDGFLKRVQETKAANPSLAAGDPSIVKQSASQSRTSPQPTGLPEELTACTDYHVLKELGRGGMGVVYLAKYIPMDRVEVLKVLSDQLVTNDSAKQRFRNEMRAIGKLNHPAIATAYQQVPLPTQLVFSMEYVPGVDLHRFIRKYHPVPIPVACTLALQIAAALQHANSKHTVHRDIKPSNVMVFKEDGNLRIKILDFGLAKASSERNTEGLTVDGTMLGTPEYMAPEQALNAAAADIRADIYSLGCTLYHLLMGKPPFSGTFQSVLMAHAQQEADYVSLSRLDVPVELSKIIAKMMAKEPSKRYSTPKQVADALKPFAGKANFKSQTQIDPAKTDTHVDLPSPSRDTSIEQPVIAPVVARQPSVAASLADLKVSDRRVGKSVQPAKRTQSGGGRSKLPPTLAIASGGGFLALLLAAVLMLRTGEGTIVIENLPDDAEVLVDQETIQLRWNEGESLASVRVKPGTRHVEVRSGGIAIAGETVTIERGDQETIRLKVQPVEPSESVPPTKSPPAVEAVATVPSPMPPPTPSVAPEVAPSVTPTRPPGGTIQPLSEASLDRLFSPGAVWGGSDNGRPVSLTMLSRTGTSFRASFSMAQGFQREVRGEIKEGKMSWLASDVHAIAGNVGGDNSGTVLNDAVGPRIDFQWQGPGDRSGSFAVRPQGPLVPPQDAVEFRGSHYKLFTEKLTWHEARNRCTLLGGNLAVVKSQEENDFLFQISKKAGLDAVWVGASDEDQEGKWTWITGEPLRYRNWVGSQPDNKDGGEDFMVLIANFTKVRRVQSFWADQPNQSVQHNPGYFCQWFGREQPDNNAEGSDSGNLGSTSSISQPQPSTNEFVQLFDGSDTSAWQSLGPFKVRDGMLVAKDGEGLAISRDEYDDFELVAEWKIGPNANSGIYYRELSSQTSAGTEYQIIDEVGFANVMSPKMSTGSLWRVIAPAGATNTRLGQWNTTRIVCNGTKVEHWLNGKKLLEYDTSSPSWRKTLSESRRRGQPDIHVRRSGHILLQSLDGEVAFRSISIRPISG
ncbi:protein kinase domain-containing protein [Rosistilla oblonga]|uniref:protein kinase domain-containing protein n=1 Tax=Rosistilla oblonga TaxID=2527990 RepID=UPI003A96CC22